MSTGSFAHFGKTFRFIFLGSPIIFKAEPIRKLVMQDAIFVALSIPNENAVILSGWMSLSEKMITKGSTILLAVRCGIPSH